MKKNKFGALIPETATVSLKAFLDELHTNELLVNYIFLAQDYIEENKGDAIERLKEVYEDETNEASKRMIDFLGTEEASDLFDIRTYEHYFGQMAFSRAIDNATTYFKDILGEVIVKRPQILKTSKESEKLDFILDFENIDDLKRALAEKKITELFYKGIDDIEKYFNDRLGISLFEDQDDKKEFGRFVKQRNLIVHNRGRITDEFVKEFPEFTHPSGYYFTFTFEDISIVHLALNNFLCTLDEEISAKFQLEKIDNW